MKKYIIFLTLLLLILVKIPVIAAETKVGFGGDWEIGSQLKVNMLTGVFVDEKKQYDYWVRGNLLYVPIDQNGIHGFLTLEKRGSFSDICLGYINPFNEKLDLEVGVNWTKKENKTTEKFIVNGNWNTTYGTVFLGGKLGLNGEEITLKYFRPYEKHLHNKLILKGNVGLQHLWEREGREISIPLRAKGIYQLTDVSQLVLEVEDNYSLTKKENDLDFSLYWHYNFGKNSVPILLSEIDNTQLNHQISSPIENEIKDSKLECVEDSQEKEESKSTIIEETEIIQAVSVINLKEESMAEVKPYYDQKLGTFYYKNQEVKINSLVNNNQIYLPIRFLVESLGGKVFWHENLQQINIVLNEKKVLLDVKKNNMMENGSAKFINELEIKENHYYINVDDLVELIYLEK